MLDLMIRSSEFALGVHLGSLQRFRDLRVRFGVRSRLKKAPGLRAQ